jgi:hypothetical protein
MNNVNEHDCLKQENGKLKEIVCKVVQRVYPHTPCEFCGKGILLCLLDGGKCHVKDGVRSE